jgi:hypothetical protein
VSRRTDLRCHHKKFGELLEDEGTAIIEIKCSSKFCGAGNGVMVLHRFDAESGKLLETLRFREPDRTYDEGRQ